MIYLSRRRAPRQWRRASHQLRTGARQDGAGSRANLEAAGLGDLVDIREGDALDTLKDVGGEVDLLLIDGAFSPYLPVLRLVEPRLKPEAVVLGETAFEPGYLDYVRNPANGYDSIRLQIDAANGNEFSARKF